MTAYFEDYAVGDVLELGEISVTEQEIIDFATLYDPQTFHLDPELAVDGPFGGLIASGWHSVALVTRLWVEAVLARTAACGSPGVEEIRWLVPVRPGDTLRAQAIVLASRASATKPWRGTFTTRIEATNQCGELALHFTSLNMVRRRGSP